MSAEPNANPNPAPAERGDAILSNRLKAGGRAALAPIVNVLAAIGVTPNSVTVAGLVIVLAASLLIWRHALLAGAVILAIGAALDGVDGGLARAQGGGTAFGGFLDSTLDRTAEAIVYLGITAYYLGAASQPFAPVMLAGLALSGSFLVSYSRARAEAAGFAASNGLAPRTERLIIIVLGLAITGLGFAFALPIAMGLVAVLAWVTVAQRIWNVNKQAAAAAVPPTTVGQETIGQDKEN